MQENSVQELIAELEQKHAEIAELQSTSREHTRLKEQLRASEERYRVAFEYTGTAMLVLNEDMTVAMANHKLEEITGHNHEVILRKVKWTDVVSPRDVDRMVEFHTMRRDNPEKTPNEYEFRLIDKNGNERELLLNATMLPGSKKSLVSLVDITKIKRVDQALRDSERRYRDLYENANDIIYTIDLDGNFTSANLTAQRIYGYTAEEILQTHIRMLIDPAYLQLAMEKIDEKQRIGAPGERYELLTRTREGKPVWVEVSTRLIRESNRSVGIQGIARDITERKKQEEQLQESRERFQEIADLLPGIICEMDLSMTLTYVNRMGLDVFGFSREDYTRGITIWELIPPGIQEEFKQDVYNVTHGDFGHPKTYGLYKKDRSVIQVIINSAPIIKQGKLVGVRSCLVDISDRYRAEQLLRESEERFRNIYSCSPIGIALYLASGELLDKNESFTGMVSSLSSSYTMENLFSTSGIGKQLQERLRKGERCSVAAELPLADGNATEKRWFDWSITSITLQGSDQLVYLAQVQDSTDRKRAEDAQLQKERDATARAEALVVGLRRELREQAGFEEMVSRSPRMKQIFDIIPEVAQAKATVLITGESGTGKELIARSLHNQSNRRKEPFIAINCGALPDNLLESELFGYKAGAFTDAKKDKPGKFALAEAGTLFLDEIGEISPAMQVKLLRVLQERVYEPLGGVEPIRANVRVVTATNRNLFDMVKSGVFREDLFYRVNVVNIELPPLRERRCDIPLLCDHFVERFNNRYERNIEGVSERVLELLMANDFPGNIRELENLIEHAFIFCKKSIIDYNHLPPSFQNTQGPIDATSLLSVGSFKELERLYLKCVLDECCWDKIAATKWLGIHKATLFRKIKQFGLVGQDA